MILTSPVNGFPSTFFRLLLLIIGILAGIRTRLPLAHSVVRAARPGWLSQPGLTGERRPHPSVWTPQGLGVHRPTRLLLVVLRSRGGPRSGGRARAGGG